MALRTGFKPAREVQRVLYGPRFTVQRQTEPPPQGRTPVDCRSAIENDIGLARRLAETVARLYALNRGVLHGDLERTDCAAATSCVVRFKNIDVLVAEDVPCPEGGGCMCFFAQQIRPETGVKCFYTVCCIKGLNEGEEEHIHFEIELTTCLE